MTSQADLLPAERAPDTRAQLLKARDGLADVFAILEAVAPRLEEPERAAALMLRGDIASALRRTGNLAAFLGGRS